MKNFLITILVLFLISACGGKPSTVEPTPTQPPVSIPLPESNNPPLPTVTPVCISPEPVQADIDRALTYAGDLFSEPDWARSYTVGDGRVSVSWSNDPIGAIAYVEALIFPCSYEEPDLDNFFNDDNWKVIFGNYTSYEPVAACKTNDGLRLYQFKATVTDPTTSADVKYAVNYWAQNDSDTRVVTVMTVFPVDSQSLIDKYSTALFPNLTSCP